MTTAQKTGAACIATEMVTPSLAGLRAELKMLIYYAAAARHNKTEPRTEETVQTMGVAV